MWDLTTDFHVRQTKNSSAEQRSFINIRKLLFDNGSEEYAVSEAGTSDDGLFTVCLGYNSNRGEEVSGASFTSDNGLFSSSLGVLAKESKEGVVGEGENEFFFSSFFNDSFFSNSFFNNSFFNNSFFSSNFFNSNFFNNNFFSSNFFNDSFFSYESFFSDGSGSSSDESDESGDEFIGKFETECYSSSLKGNFVEFDAAVQDHGNNFRGNFDAVGCSESNNCFNVNVYEVAFNNFFNGFSGSGVNDCFVNGFGNSFFSHNCGSHCSAEKSCENERKSLLHFCKILLR